jgi:hypothetical protein
MLIQRDGVGCSTKLKDTVYFIYVKLTLYLPIVNTKVNIVHKLIKNVVIY